MPETPTPARPATGLERSAPGVSLRGNAPHPARCSRERRRCAHAHVAPPGVTAIPQRPAISRALAVYSVEREGGANGGVAIVQPAPARESRPARARPTAPWPDREAPAPRASSVTLCGSRGAALATASASPARPGLPRCDVRGRQLARDAEVGRPVKQQPLRRARSRRRAPAPSPARPAASARGPPRRPFPTCDAGLGEAGYARRCCPGEPDDLAQRRRRLLGSCPACWSSSRTARARAARPPPCLSCR